MIKDIIMRDKRLLHNRGFREISPLSKKPLSIERNGLEATQPTKPQLPSDHMDVCGEGVHPFLGVGPDFGQNPLREAVKGTFS
jgi:hypothetical protein